MSFSLRILDDRSIGRYFQAAALGYIFPLLPSSLQDKVLEGFSQGSTSLTSTEVATIINTLSSEVSKVCQSKRSFPRWYLAGVGDSKILASITFKGEFEGWCNWLISAAQFTIKKPDIEVRTPMFLKAYVFSKYRDVGKAEKEDINALSLYVAAVGAVVSLVAGELRRGENVYELYVVPDTSLDSIKEAFKLYSLLHISIHDEGLEDILRGLLRNESLSYELAIIFATALHVYRASLSAAKMSLSGFYNLFERYRLVNIKPEMRPQVQWERPLSLTPLLKQLEERRVLDLLYHLYTCTSYSIKFAERVERAADITAQCISSMFAYLEAGSLDSLLACVASATRVAEKFSELCYKAGQAKASDAESLCSAEREFKFLVKDIAKLHAF